MAVPHPRTGTGLELPDPKSQGSHSLELAQPWSSLIPNPRDPLESAPLLPNPKSSRIQGLGMAPGPQPRPRDGRAGSGMGERGQFPGIGDGERRDQPPGTKPFPAGIRELLQDGFGPSRPLPRAPGAIPEVFHALPDTCRSPGSSGLGRGPGDARPPGGLDRGPGGMRGEGMSALGGMRDLGGTRGPGDARFGGDAGFG